MRKQNKHSDRLIDSIIWWNGTIFFFRLVRVHLKRWPTESVDRLWLFTGTIDERTAVILLLLLER